MSDHLFDPNQYGEERTVRILVTPADADVEPLVPPWVLLANRRGVIGFHVLKSTDHYATAHTLCGLQGHVVEPPDQMVRCRQCEELRISEV